MRAALVLVVVIACGGSQPAIEEPAAPPPPISDQDAFDGKNSELRDRLAPLIEPGKTAAEYSGLKGSFAHRIRAPYKDIIAATAKQLDSAWQIEIEIKSERDKDRNERIYVKGLASEYAATRAVELLLALRDHHSLRK